MTNFITVNDDAILAGLQSLSLMVERNPNAPPPPPPPPPLSQFQAGQVVAISDFNTKTKTKTNTDSDFDSASGDPDEYFTLPPSKRFDDLTKGHSLLYRFVKLKPKYNMNGVATEHPPPPPSSSSSASGPSPASNLPFIDGKRVNKGTKRYKSIMKRGISTINSEIDDDFRIAQIVGYTKSPNTNAILYQVVYYDSLSIINGVCIDGQLVNFADYDGNFFSQTKSKDTLVSHPNSRKSPAPSSSLDLLYPPLIHLSNYNFRLYHKITGAKFASSVDEEQVRNLIAVPYTNNNHRDFCLQSKVSDDNTILAMKHN